LEQYLLTNPKDAPAVRERLEQIRNQHLAASSRPPVPAIGLLAGGGAALIIGIACGGAAIAAANTVAHANNNANPSTADLLNTQERGKQLNGAAIAFDVIGGAALAAGGAWLGYWLYKRQKAKHAAPAPTTALVPQGLGIAFTRSF